MEQKLNQKMKQAKKEKKIRGRERDIQENAFIYS